MEPSNHEASFGPRCWPKVIVLWLFPESQSFCNHLLKAPSFLTCAEAILKATQKKMFVFEDVQDVISRDCYIQG